MTTNNNHWNIGEHWWAEEILQWVAENPNSEISAEISETLGSKFQNVRNFTLRVSGGAMEEAILSYSKINPNVQVLSVETPQKGGSYRFSGNPRTVVRFCIHLRMTGRCLCNGLFKTYALTACWILSILGSSMRFISFSMYLNHNQT